MVPVPSTIPAPSTPPAASAPAAFPHPTPNPQYPTPAPSHLPPLSPSDRQLLITFIRFDFNHVILANHFNMELDEVIQWATRPDIQAWIGANESLRRQNTQITHDRTLDLAISALESTMLESQKRTDPASRAEVRRSAFGIISAIRLVGRASRPPGVALLSEPGVKPSRRSEPSTRERAKTQGQQSLGLVPLHAKTAVLDAPSPDEPNAPSRAPTPSACIASDCLTPDHPASPPSEI